MKVSFPEIPGVLVDVPALLSGLAADTLVTAVKAAVAAGSQPSQTKVSLRACGLALDVVELLRSLGRQDLLGVIRGVVEPRAAVRNKLVQELQQLVGPGPGTAELALARTAGGGMKLPQIGGAGSSSPGAGGAGGAKRPPKMPGMAQRPKGGLGEALLKAIREKDVSGAKLLIAQRADVGGSPGGSPLATALMQGVPPGFLQLLLEARSDVHECDDQGRSAAHLWAWNLPKSRAGVHEAQKKLTILTKGGADLDAQLAASGDAPLHILAKVFNSLSSCAAAGSNADPLRSDAATLGKVSAAEAERFLKGTRVRIDLLVNSGADVNLCNTRGQRPMDLVERRFRAELPCLGPSPGRNAGGDSPSALASPQSTSKTGLRVKRELPEESGNDD